MYCTPGNHSAAVPLFPTSQFTLPTYPPGAQTREAHNAPQLRDTLANGCWSPERYQSRPVAPGDMLIFPQTTPHYGTHNRAIISRVTLFSILTPFTGSLQDDYQLYYWMYVESAFGVHSVEMARALYQERAELPLSRLVDNAHGRNAHDIYLGTLLRWNYARVTDAKQRSWVWRPPAQHETRQLTDAEVAQCLKPAAAAKSARHPLSACRTHAAAASRACPEHAPSPYTH